MTLHKRKDKNCANCNQSLTFEEFWRINPSISQKKVIEFWNNPMILIYCPDCYFINYHRLFINLLSNRFF